MTRTDHASAARLSLSLSPREPFDVRRVFAFLSARAIHGLEVAEPDSYLRSLRLPHGQGVLQLRPAGRAVDCRLDVSDPSDLPDAVGRCRWLLDLDSDPVEIDSHLAADRILAGSVRRMPGLRVPGHVDGFEVAVRAIVGQQITVAGARTIAGRLTARYGERLTVGASTAVTHVFPQPQVLASLDPASLPMPVSRARCVVGVARAVAAGSVILDRTRERAEVRESLLALKGSDHGPPTTSRCGRSVTPTSSWRPTWE